MSRLKVHLWAGLRRFTGGAEVVEVEADTIGQMLTALTDTYPGLGPLLKDGVSVAVDGEIVTGGRHRQVSAENEIFLMQRLRGG